MEIQWLALRSAAVAAMRRAYAPYSNFPVGAAALVDDGRVVTGCNVENACYGVGLCAECGLVSQLHAGGGGRLVAVSCVDGSGAPLMPCGRCRQLLWEHGGPDCLVDAAGGPVARARRRPRSAAAGSPGRRPAVVRPAVRPAVRDGGSVMSEPFAAVEVIRTKRDGEALSDAQIDWV